MASSLRLRVITPAETLLQVEEAQWIHARLADGAGISIYPGHAPLLAETVTASLHYADASGDHRFGAQAGILQIEDNQVTLFTSGESAPAERPSIRTTVEMRFERLAGELQDGLAEDIQVVLGDIREES